MNKNFLINLTLGLLYLSMFNTVVLGIIIFNLFLINKFKKSENKKKGSSEDEATEKVASFC